MLNSPDKQLHNALHAEMLRQPANEIFKPRVQIFSEFQIAFGKLYGNILDVGAGNGYASIWIAKNCPDVTEIVALDASQPAVSQLIPRNAEYHQVSNRVLPKLGSFDDLGESKKFNFVVAMGALHHSKNLFTTLSSIGKAIKPGGYLIAQEPAMPDSTTHEDYQRKYEIIEERYDLKIRNGDRHDHFFRECEYKAALVLSGFDIVMWKVWHPRGQINDLLSKKVIGIVKNFFRKATAKSSRHQNSSKPPWESEMQSAKANVKPYLIVARRSELNNVYHAWDIKNYEV